MVDIRIKDLADGSAVLDDTDLLAFDSGADGTRKVTLAGLRSTMLAAGVTLVDGVSDWLLAVTTPAVVGGAGRSIGFVAASGADGDGVTVGGGGGHVYITGGEGGASGGAGAGGGGDVLIDGGGGSGVFGDVLIGSNATAQVLIKGGLTELTAVELRANVTTIKGVQAGLGSVVIEATNAASSVRVNIAGTETLRVESGQVLVHAGTSTVPGLAGLTDDDTGWRWAGANTLGFIGGGFEWIQIQASGLYGASSSGLSINAGVVGAPLVINGGQTTGTTSGVRISNTFTLTGSSGVQTLCGLTATLNQTSTAGFTAFDINITETAVGSGAQRLLDARIGGTSRIYVDNKGRSVQAPQLVAATGDEVGVDIAPTVNKATSGNYTALRVNATETAAPGTDDRLLDLRVGGVSKMRVSNAGVVRGEELQSTQYVEKTADQSITSSTSLQDDNHLFCNLLAGGTYHFVFHVLYSTASATPGIKLGLTGPGSQVKWSTFGVEFDGTFINPGGHLSGFGSNAFAGVSAGAGWVRIEGTVEAGSAGILRLQFAQQTSSADAVTVLRNSSLVVSRCA
jgi:hypothetical protein